ncbi:calcium-binding protein [Paracoccus fontiphilus]|uniref:Ca2+-binding protein, RTX toxin-related n=1 Tax=Paracoccus fontiphilus TaxID=1815556 RepID=A0ABV7INM4_9RHOB|nr:calcium-binding protein [Paracoccus fontiphilus]
MPTLKDTGTNSDFLSADQDLMVYNVEAGTTNAQLQQLLDAAMPGATINLAAGTYVITETLRISRGDITLKGAGEGKTIFSTEIGLDTPSPTILVQPDDLQDRHGKLPVRLVEGSNKVVLPDFEASRSDSPGSGHAQFKVGDLIFVSQQNDKAYLKVSGNLDNPDGLGDWNEPAAAGTGAEELYYLREFRSHIVSIENGVATLAEASPYSFAAGVANVVRNTFLENVTLSDFTIQGDFSDEAGGKPDPFLFANTIPEWGSIAALELDGVRDSALERITVIDPAAHGFKWQRAHETTADALTATGAHNKGGSSGYHFMLQESFANDFINLSSTDARHAVLFSSYNAEHYNSLHLRYSNRDINFHGSADNRNTVVVDVLDQDYPGGVLPQWQAVQPGTRGLHPLSDIENNDVTFRYARSGDRSDRIVAHVEGGDIAMRGGPDLGLGQAGNDRFSGGAGNDTLQGNGGADILNGGVGKDRLVGGSGNDTLIGGEGNDVLQGGDGDDLIDGGANGDNLYGGKGRDTFLRRFADLTDTIHDFEGGAAGDVLLIKGMAYTAFSQLELRQAGADVIVDFGPTGYTLLRNILLDTLTAENFAFAADVAAGQNIAMKARQMLAVGTDKNDVFTASRTHVTEPGFTVHGGAGFDEIRLLQSSLNANLGRTGTFTGIEGFDLSATAKLDLIIENPLVAQSDNATLSISVGDLSAGKPVLLDVGPLGRGKSVVIDGGRQVQLTGGREHTVMSGNDTGVNIVGDRMRDIVHGGRADDMIRGGAGNDVLFGGAGQDTLKGDGGNDTLNGGPGSDLLIVDNIGDRVAENRRWEGIDTVRASVDFRMGSAHVENLELVGEAELGVGNGLRNLIIGNDGDNILDGGKNVDTLVGGSGNDTYLLRTLGDKVVEKANGGIDTVKAYRSIELPAYVENLYIQTLLNNTGKGVAEVNGIGNDLDNILVGNPFGNTLAGRGGNDTLRGQAGADSFVFDRSPHGGNVDHILDFNANEPHEGDMLMMKQSVFGGIAKGRLAEGHFYAGTTAHDANDRFIFDQAAGRLWFDTDGTGEAAPDLVATFAGNAGVMAWDIVLF